MGTWGTRSFENDTALDWTEELCSSRGTREIVKVLDQQEDEGYLEAWAAQQIIAACEVIAALTGKVDIDLPDNLLAWLQDNSSLHPEELTHRAVAKLERVLGDESELQQLWAENEEDYQSWVEQIRGLIRRLTSD